MACLPMLTPCAFFGIPCPRLGCFSHNSVKVCRVKMTNGCNLNRSEAGNVLEETWTSLDSAPAQRVTLSCDGYGNIVIPFGHDTITLQNQVPPPFAVLQGLFGKIVMRTDEGCGWLLPKSGAGATGYELICDEDGRPILPYGKNAVRYTA